MLMPLFAVLYFLLDKNLCLILTADSGHVRVVKLGKDREFNLRFIHSVHLTPVKETFTVFPSGSIQLTTVQYETYGVGMPFLPSEGSFSWEGNSYVLRGLDRRFDQIDLRVGLEAKQVLLVDFREYPLYEWGGETGLIRIKSGYCNAFGCE
jgi:hypothetical protein